MQAEDYRMISDWCAIVMSDRRVVKSDALADAVHTLMEHSWDLAFPKAKPMNETHAHTLGGSR